MKIAVYLDELGPEEGGGFTFQDDILRSLLRRGNAVSHEFIVYSNLGGTGGTGGGKSSIRFVRMRRNRKWSKFLRFAEIYFYDLFYLGNVLGFRNRFERSLREEGVEFVWFVTPRFLPVDIPYAYTVWDLQHRLQPWFPEVSARGKWRFREENYAHMIPRATVLIIGNEAGKEDLVRFYNVPPERVLMLPHPTPSFALGSGEANGHDIHAKYDIPGDYLFYPAQFWPHKNHVGLLRSVKLLQERHRLEIPVVFAGSDSGNLRHVKETAKSLGLADRVYFLGFVPREDLICLYRSALAMAYLSFFGPENLPPLEAFALRCPVIASRVPGAEEQMGDAALLVNPMNPEDIAEAIRSVSQSPRLREQLVLRGLERASKWTAEDYVRKLMEFFDEFESVRHCWTSTTDFT